MPIGNLAEEDRAAALSETTPRSTAPVPWIVTAVEARPNFSFFVHFRDGTSGPVYMKEKLSRPCGVFEALRDPNVFATVRVGEGDVVWPIGLDLAPDAMYDEIKAHGEWVLR